MLWFDLDIITFTLYSMGLVHFALTFNPTKEMVSQKNEKVNWGNLIPFCIFSVALYPVIMLMGIVPIWLLMEEIFSVIYKICTGRG